MPQMIEVSQSIEVIDETDVVVLGGSCTGVFAAVRAARMGSRVSIVEKQNHFGGVAAITCTWHTLKDSEHRQDIIAGLTLETLQRLDRRGAVNFTSGSQDRGSEFRPGNLKVVLDELIADAGVRPHLHTLFSSPYVRDGKLQGVIVENKSGRGLIKARAFIDATGDGDLCHRLGLEEYNYPQMLPPTVCAFVANWRQQGVDLGRLIKEHGAEVGLAPGYVWGSVMPKTDVFMMAGTRILHVDCAQAADLTRAEMEGRRQVQAIMDLLAKYQPEANLALLDFPMSIGIRDTRHIRCLHQLKGEELLGGERFPDAIANGSYRMDTHHQDKPGITFMYLDGRRVYDNPGCPQVVDRWRPESASNPTFYQVPLRSLIPQSPYANLILAGRMLDADHLAFSGVRVMVNMNQTGEAAGVAAHLSLAGGTPLASLDAAKVRSALAAGGSIVL